MKISILSFSGGRKKVLSVTPPFKIGRDEKMDLSIRSWLIKKHHATFIKQNGDFFIKDNDSLSGTLYNREKVDIGGPLKPRDEIIIGNCRIQVEEL